MKLELFTIPDLEWSKHEGPIWKATAPATGRHYLIWITGDGAVCWRSSGAAYEAESLESAKAACNQHSRDSILPALKRVGPAELRALLEGALI